MALAELGRRRAGGRAVFPASSSLLAPVWVLERGVCAWLAVLQRLRFGGVRYGDAVIPLAAHSERRVPRRRRRARASSPGSGRSLPLGGPDSLQDPVTFQRWPSSGPRTCWLGLGDLSFSGGAAKCIVPPAGVWSWKVIVASPNLRAAAVRSERFCLSTQPAL